MKYRNDGDDDADRAGKNESEVVIPLKHFSNLVRIGFNLVKKLCFG